MKLAHEDHRSKGRPRFTSAAEDKFIKVTSQIAAKINASEFK